MSKKKTVSRRSAPRANYQKYFSTRVNFIILILFCILVASIFNILYKGY